MGRWWLLVLATLLSTAAEARRYRMEDLLDMRGYGQVVVAERVGLVLFERRRPYGEASDYSLQYFVRRQLSEIYAVDLSAPRLARRLLPARKDAGYWIGSLSPSGRRLAVFRLQGGRLSLGIVDLLSRQVRWLSASPDLPLAAPKPTWMNERELAFVAMPVARLPYILSLGRALQEDLPPLWRRQKEGRVSSADAVIGYEGPERKVTRRLFVVADVRTGASRTLADGDIVDAIVSPDRTRIALLMAGEPTAPPATGFDTSFVARRHTLAVIDAAGTMHGHRASDIMPNALEWQAGSSGLIAVIRNGGSDWASAHFVVVSREGALRRLGTDSIVSTRSDGSSISVGRGWMGDKPLGLVAAPDGGERWVAFEGDRPRPLPLPARSRVVASDPNSVLFSDGRSLSLVTGSTSRELGIADRVGTTALDPYSVGTRNVPAHLEGLVATVGGSSGTVLRFAPTLGDRSPSVAIATTDRVLAVGRSPAVAITLHETVAGVQSLRLVRPGASDVVFDRINEHLGDVDPLRAIRLTASVGGHSLTSWLYLPAVLPGSGAPLIMLPYPGTTWTALLPAMDAASAGTSNGNVRLLVAAGYAVLRPGLPSTDDVEARSDAIVAQTDAALDAALATGRIDRRRVAVMGHSFGGYAALTLATRSMRYRAVIAESGVYDLVSNHGTMAGGDSIRMEMGLPYANAEWTEGGQGAMLEPPTPGSALYASASPLRAIRAACAPILLIHGDVDAVSIGGAERLFVELARQGSDVSLVRYRGEGHILYSPANVRDYYRRILSFLRTRMPLLGADDRPGLSSAHHVQARYQASKLVCTTRAR